MSRAEADTRFTLGGAGRSLREFRVDEGRELECSFALGGLGGTGGRRPDSLFDRTLEFAPDAPEDSFRRGRACVVFGAGGKSDVDISSPNSAAMSSAFRPTGALDSKPYDLQIAESEGSVFKIRA